MIPKDINEEINRKIVAWRDAGLTYLDIAKFINDEYQEFLIKPLHPYNSIKHRYLRNRGKDSIDTITPPQMRRLPASYGRIEPIEGRGNVLVIADTHLPFEHPRYLAHCMRVKQQFDCSIVVHIGDLVDSYMISRFPKSHDDHSVGSEIEDVLSRLQYWVNAFPKMHLCIGNHDARYYRNNQSNGGSEHFLRNLQEIWGTPDSWQWARGWRLGKTCFEHGTKSAGKNGAINRAIKKMRNTVIGHSHVYGGIQFHTGDEKTIFGMNVGAGIDPHSLAAAYGKDYDSEMTLGCGVIVEGLPIFVPL